MNLKIGDILINGTSKRKVLGVCGEVVFVSLTDEFEIADCDNLTEKELLSKNWSVEKKEWEPEDNKLYWFVDDCGDIQEDFYDEESDIDSFRLATHNVFKTSELAEKHREELLKK